MTEQLFNVECEVCGKDALGEGAFPKDTWLIEENLEAGFTRFECHCYKCNLTTPHKKRIIMPGEKQETIQQEATGNLSLSEILDLAVPAIQEIKEDIAGLSELRSRVELAKVFVWRGQDGNMNFNQSDYEAVWNAITGQNQAEKPAN